MEKYRLISIWHEVYVPKNYRQDGVAQERVEEINLTLEEVSVKFKLLYNPRVKEGWGTERYEVDGGEYRSFELIRPGIVYNAKKTENPEGTEITNKTKPEQKYKATPFCRCLNEIENNLPLTEYCFMACKEQKEIFKQRKIDKLQNIDTHPRLIKYV